MRGNYVHGHHLGVAADVRSLFHHHETHHEDHHEAAHRVTIDLVCFCCRQQGLVAVEEHCPGRTQAHCEAAHGLDDDCPIVDRHHDVGDCVRLLDLVLPERGPKLMMVPQAEPSSEHRIRLTA